VTSIRFTDEFDGGVSWIAAEPARMQRSCHALGGADGVWIVDPVGGEGVDEQVFGLGPPAGVIQLLDRHGRDCAALAKRYGVQHLVTPFDGVPGSPFDAVSVARWPGWMEVALWWPERRILVVAESLGTASYFLAPGETIGVHPLRRLLPPRSLVGFEPQRLLLGHGEGVYGSTIADDVERAVCTARRRIPSWLVHVASGR
jgi:hypothetical protein